MNWVTICERKDRNENSELRASRNYCRCGKHDPNIPIGADLIRVNRYICEKCKEGLI